MSITVPPVPPIPPDGHVTPGSSSTNIGTVSPGALILATSFGEEIWAPSSRFGVVLMQYLEPWLTLHMAWLLDAIGTVVDPIYTLVSDVGDDDGVTPTVGTFVNGELVTTGYQPGWGEVLNPQACPAEDLPYLAQFVGVQLPQGADDATARSLILEEAGLNRGTDAAVIAAAKRFLTGTQTVQLIPRTYVDGTPTAGWFLIIVLASEVTDATALTAAVNAVKFGGLMWTLIQTTMFLIDTLEADYTTITQVETTFASITALEGDET